MRLPVSVLLLLLLALPAAARVRVAGRVASSTPASVLWIGAHPDDESLIAPLLAKWCREGGARCGIVVLTRGESGPCLRAGGCLPDLATVRAAEAGAASEYFHADSIVLRLPDGGGILPPEWNPTAVDAPDIITRVAAQIEAFRPSVIMTFDPRHGTTCHPDHRETARIVLEASKRLTYEPELLLLESRVSVSANPFAIHFSSASTVAERFDANEILKSTALPAWNAILDDMERHASQFDEPWLVAVRQVPTTNRIVAYAPAETILQQEVAGCP